VQYLRSILVLALVVSAFAEDAPTASQLAAFEQFATRPSTRVAWSTEVGVIEGGGARATIAAVVMEDKTARMRGVRIDLRGENGDDRVYIAEEFIEKLISALEEIAAGMGELAHRSTPSRCQGSGAFLRAMREGAHFFHASQCSMADGWFGLFVSTGTAKFRFTSRDPLPFAAAMARAAQQLKQH